MAPTMDATNAWSLRRAPSLASTIVMATDPAAMKIVLPKNDTDRSTPSTGPDIQPCTRISILRSRLAPRGKSSSVRASRTNASANAAVAAKRTSARCHDRGDVWAARLLLTPALSRRLLERDGTMTLHRPCRPGPPRGSRGRGSSGLLQEVEEDGALGPNPGGNRRPSIGGEEGRMERRKRLARAPRLLDGAGIRRAEAEDDRGHAGASELAEVLRHRIGREFPNALRAERRPKGRRHGRRQRRIVHGDRRAHVDDGHGRLLRRPRRFRFRLRDPRDAGE